MNNFSSLSSIPEVAISKAHESIKRSHEIAFKGLENQAKRMKRASDAKFIPLEMRMSVLPVPDVDKSKADSRNLIGNLNILLFIIIFYCA